MIAHPDRESTPTRRPASSPPLRTADGAHASSSRNALAEGLRHGVLRPAAVLALQRTVGNRAVVQLLARERTPVRSPGLTSGQTGRVQRFAEPPEEVPFDSEHAELARGYRSRTRNWDWQPNVASIRIGDFNETEISNANSGWHAEVALMEDANVKAHVAGDERGIAELYSERIPCPACKGRLRKFLPQKTQKVYYSNPLNSDGRNDGQEEMMRVWASGTTDAVPFDQARPSAAAQIDPGSSDFGVDDSDLLDVPMPG